MGNPVEYPFLGRSLNTQGGCCPKCGSADIDVTRRDIDYKTMDENIICLICKSTFTFEYSTKIAGITDSKNNFLRME